MNQLFFGREYKAFSLIELSIVILVIGILIAGTLEGSVLYSKFKIKTAQSITINSDVNSIEDLSMWFETSLDESITSDSNSYVTRWNDINPQSRIKVDAYDTYGTLPVYVENVINGLPVVQFKDSAKSIKIDPNGNGMNFIVGTDYTIFVVEQRVVSGDINGNYGMFLRGNGGGYSTNLQYGYWNDNFISNDWGYDWSIPVTLSSKITPRIHTLKFQNSTGKYYSMKSNISDPYSATRPSFAGYPLVSYSGAAIGGDAGSDDLSLAEMIVFSRALKTSEINLVEAYLGKKYAIKVN
jgi:prepilin-type N-terminal cleavage/methylation domain-containing protein